MLRSVGYLRVAALCPALLLAWTPTASGQSLRTGASIEVHEMSIAGLQQALTEHEVTARHLVQGYLGRTPAYDRDGPAA